MQLKWRHTVAQGPGKLSGLLFFIQAHTGGASRKKKFAARQTPIRFPLKNKKNSLPVFFVERGRVF